MMKKKAAFALLASVLFLFSLWLAALGFSGLQGNENAGKPDFLTVEKKGLPVTVQLAFINPPQSEPAGSRAGEFLLAGMLMLFIAVSAAGAGFVCHLLRGDDSAG